VSSDGLLIRGVFTISWFWFWLIILVVLALLVWLVWHFRRWHRDVSDQHLNRRLPENVKDQLEELKQYRAKYGHLAVIFLAAALSLSLGLGNVKAQAGTPL